MKTAISIPDPLFKAAEQLARRMRVSRSQLYASAIAFFIERRKRKDVTERLNAVYKSHPATIDPAIQSMQARSLDQWK